MKNNKTKRNKKRSSGFLRKSRKYRKNMTGGEEEKKEREGVMDILGSKIKEKTGDIKDYVATKTARLFGFKPIEEKEKQQEKEQAAADQGTSLLGKATDLVSQGTSLLGLGQATDQGSSLVGEVADQSKALVGEAADQGVALADQGAALAVQGVNEVLDAPQTEMAVQEAATATKEVAEDLLETFNEPFEDPNFKKEVKEAADNAAEGATIVLKAMDKPIDVAIDKTSESMTKMGSAIAAGSVKVATDALAAVPGAGAIFDLGRMINDASRAAASVVEASAEIVETGSDMVITSVDSVKGAVDDFKNLGKEKTDIENRVNNSINDFTNPQPTVGGKTRRRLFKKRGGRKTKHVRFAI